MKINKISTKIILAISLVSIVVSLSLATLSITTSAKLFDSETQEKMTLLAESKANQFNTTLQSTASSIENLKSTVASSLDLEKYKTDEEYVAMYDELISNLIVGSVEEDKLLSLYFYFDPDVLGRPYSISHGLDENSKIIRKDQLAPEAYDRDDEGMDWFYDPIIKQSAIWMDPYFWEAHQKNIISYTVPIIQDGLVIGIAGADIDFAIFEDEIDDMKIYENGYAFLVNENLDYIVPSDITKEKDLKSIDDSDQKKLSEQIKNETSGVLENVFNDTTNLVSFKRLSNGNTIVISVTKKELFKNIDKLRGSLIAGSLLAVLFSVIIGLIIGKKISVPIVRLSKLADDTSQLNMSFDDSVSDLDKQNDEISLMAKSFFNVRSSLRDVITTLRNASGQVLENSNNLTSTVEATTESINEIAGSLDELSHGTSVQAEKSNEGLEKLITLSSNIDNTITKADTLRNYISEAGTASTEGSETVIVFNDKIKTTLVNSNKLSQNINELSDKSKVIGDIVSTITAISRKTNLLALNASIEAARAGEAGKGFTVVAEEIRQLAEETDESTENIGNIIKEMQVSIKDTEVHMTESNELIHETSESSASVSDYFKLIEQKVQDAVDQVNEFTVDLKSMENDKNIVNHAMEEISSVSQQYAASTQEINATVEEQSANMEEINAMAYNLEQISLQLNEEIDKFNI